MKAIAPQVELFLVVGSANSSNSVRMVEVALAAGARAAHLVENAAAIDAAWLDGVDTVGLSSGASVPEILVREVLDWLAARGYGDVEEVTPHRGAADVRAAAGAAPRAASRALTAERCTGCGAQRRAISRMPAMISTPRWRGDGREAVDQPVRRAVEEHAPVVQAAGADVEHRRRTPSE